jgi:hypothetical protein
MKLTMWLKERELNSRRLAAEKGVKDREGWLHDADHLQAALAAVEERDRLRAALLNCARQAEALKGECSDDPGSTQAVRNALYQAISTTAHIALGTIRGPVQQ